MPEPFSTTWQAARVGDGGSDARISRVFLTGSGKTSQVSPDARLKTYAMAHRLEGKIAVVTGACGGIGRAVAASFAREGASVALLDRSAPSLDGLDNDQDRRHVA